MSTRSATVPEALDREEWLEHQALAEFRKAASAPCWTDRIVEALAGIADGDAVLSDYRDAAEGDAARLGMPEQRAAGIASEVLERHHLKAQEVVEKLRRELRFCQPGAEDAVARKICRRFGTALAPQVSEATLRLHLGAELAAERIERWQVLLGALSPKRRAA